ncbi:hypothetical protein CPJCM30710_14960 [Clostridium polyendosporum]|uniref:Nitrous oxide-stimulated promoter n=1 Tax=Clostridium polyendosporum TaxID=69208 RepID=A0A919VFW0_9CLOT|nr:nitrous oxide-stimulated promoter family protein [Clostridium polyendosporum]GIM28830.1 hypothetical protein CPJCM30710_14960 [Clostridium polyendosporum]
MKDKLLREQKTIQTMIKLYCKSTHNAENIPCEECSLLINYALKRLDCCKFGARKPVCAKCKIHCYKPEMRQSIRNVMRTIGPKLILTHPVMTLFHLIDSLRF